MDSITMMNKPATNLFEQYILMINIQYGIAMQIQ